MTDTRSKVNQGQLRRPAAVADPTTEAFWENRAGSVVALCSCDDVISSSEVTWPGIWSAV